MGPLHWDPIGVAVGVSDWGPTVVQGRDPHWHRTIGTPPRRPPPGLGSLRAVGGGDRGEGPFCSHPTPQGGMGVEGSPIGVAPLRPHRGTGGVL